MNLKMHPTLIALPAMLLAGLLLVAIGCEGGKTPTQLISEQFDGMVAPSPSEAARDAFNVYDPDKRRRAVVLLSNASWGGEPPYIRTYRLLVDDPDPTVRAAAVSALGRHGDRTDVDRITNRLTTDDNRIVRWEAAKALQKMHTDKAIAPLLAGLKDDDRDVRAASATALGQYPQRSVFDALVGALTDEDYGVVIAARDSLRTLTGQNFGDRGSAWWEWAEDNQQVFAEKQTYHYPQYDAPPGLLSFGQDETPEPQRPRMVEELALIDTDNVAIAGADETPEAAPPIVTRDPEPQPDPAPVVRREPAPQPQPEPTPTPTVTRTPEPEPQPAPVVTRDPEPAETVTGTGTSVTVSPPQPEPADTQPEPEPTADATPEPRPEATSTTSSTAVVVEETAPASDDPNVVTVTATSDDEGATATSETATSTADASDEPADDTTEEPTATADADDADDATDAEATSDAQTTETAEDSQDADDDDDADRNEQPLRDADSERRREQTGHVLGASG